MRLVQLDCLPGSPGCSPQSGRQSLEQEWVQGSLTLGRSFKLSHPGESGEVIQLLKPATIRLTDQPQSNLPIHFHWFVYLKGLDV